MNKSRDRFLAVHARGATETEIRATALSRAREVFGDGPVLKIMPGYTIHFYVNEPAGAQLTIRARGGAA